MYNNPYLYNNFFPYQNFPNNSLSKKGILNIFNGRKINWSSLLNNTQKTLNVINQAIPVYYQVKPIYNNAKTMFRMIGALNSTKDETSPIDNNKKNTSNGPVFFV